jgi:pimeloyl-ACP methyl ester carboxylesterase
MVGYSLGGATALQLAGARLSVEGLARRFDPNILYSEFMARVNQMSLSGDGRIRAFALIAPAVLEAFDLSSSPPRTPMLVVTGDADVTVKPAENAVRIAQSVIGLKFETLPGVAHNDFLQVCTDAGRARYAELCREPNAQREATHAKTAELIGGFFESALR